MAKSELYRRGERMRRKAWGAADFNRSQRFYDSDPNMRKFIDFATEAVFGGLWSRPGLDFKTRTLVCVVSDAATGRHPELEIHLRFALRHGWTETEIVEVLLQLSGYIGLPLVREAMLVASKVFAEERARKKSKPKGKRSPAAARRAARK